MESLVGVIHRPQIYPEEAVVKRELGSGNFGTVFIGVVQLHNGIR